MAVMITVIGRDKGEEECRSANDRGWKGGRLRGDSWVTAVGKMLFLNLLALVSGVLQHLLEERSWKSLLSGWEKFLRMMHAQRRCLFLWTSSIAGSGVPVMCWVVFTTHCSVFQSATEKFPYL